MHFKFFFFFFQLLVFLSWPVISGKVPAIIVFGDSTVDSGNNNYIPTILRSDFQPYGRDLPVAQPTGRFCNGRLASDFISEAFGLGSTVPAYLDPTVSMEDLATRVCFASAGTGLDNVTSDVMSVIPLRKELEYFLEYRHRLSDYLGRQESEQVLNEALYVISIGTNDFIENYFALVTGRFREYTVEEYQDYLIGLASQFINQLYQLGANKILFPGLSPFGCLPVERATNVLHGGACVERYNDAAKSFNVKLQSLIDELCSTLSGIRLRYSDLHGVFDDVFQDPGSYGFENVDTGCCASGRYVTSLMCDRMNPACTDANKYVFWDAFHPTEKMNHILAQNVLNTSLADFL